MERNLTLRLIETMPMGDAGRVASAHFLDLGTVRRQLREHFPLVPDIAPGGGPARYYRIDGTDARIGFITPLSQHFCATCNRVRLDVSGNLLLCLGQEHSYPLGRQLRAGVTDAGLEDALRAAMALKPERHEFSEQPGKVLRRMSMTGG
jgi:cyclic pyranopterin phosphate synthase